MTGPASAEPARPGPARPESDGTAGRTVLVGMSGGVDSSVAAAVLLEAGYEVVGVTLKLWGGDSDSGCCSVSDVDDARRVAQQLDIDHVVFNFGDQFNESVVQPYVDAHSVGVTPNPCIECNRSIKFDRLLERATMLGIDLVATGHYAQIGRTESGVFTLMRGVDVDKDQSYVVHMLGQKELARTLFPVGAMPKSRTRELAAELGLRTAHKPDSQDVCFISHSGGGREAFLGDRIETHPATVVDVDGVEIGQVAAVELVTIGQRRGLGTPGGGPKRYVVDVDVAERRVVVGNEADQLVGGVRVAQPTWVGEALDEPTEVRVQSSAHGRTEVGRLTIATDRSSSPDDPGMLEIEWSKPQRRVAPGQSVVLYDLDDRRVLGGGIAQPDRR